MTGAEELFERRTFDGALVERLARPAVAADHDLLPHPEGGWYRRVWTSAVDVRLPPGPGAGERVRPTATAVLFALPVGEASAWHVVAADELWCWHGPGPVVLELGGTGAEPATGGVLVLGADPAGGQLLQALVPSGTWQRTVPGAVDALVTCVVSPGFDPADFALHDHGGRMGP